MKQPATSKVSLAYYRWLIVMLVLCMIVWQGSYATTAYDPTRPPFYGESTYTQPGAEQLRLTMIKLQDTRHYALISGQLLTQGDTIQGYKIVKIAKNNVRLVGSKGEVVLHLLGKDFKQPVATTD